MKGENAMKKYISAVFVLIFCVFCLAGCGEKYKEKDILGKTSAEIIEKYGTFDSVSILADEDGIYRSCTCWYTVKEPRIGFLGTSPEILFFVQFDENGTAVACKEDYRPGG